MNENLRDEAKTLGSACAGTTVRLPGTTVPTMTRSYVRSLSSRERGDPAT